MGAFAKGMKKIQVSARFTTQGKIIPSRFQLGEEKVNIWDVGRQWDDEKGRHILVKDRKDRTYHLLFMFREATWYLVRDISSPPIPS
jgi:hypothetical protein